MCRILSFLLFLLFFSGRHQVHGEDTNSIHTSTQSSFASEVADVADMEEIFYEVKLRLGKNLSETTTTTFAEDASDANFITVFPASTPPAELYLNAVHEGSQPTTIGTTTSRRPYVARGNGAPSVLSVLRRNRTLVGAINKVGSHLAESHLPEPRSEFEDFVRWRTGRDKRIAVYSTKKNIIIICISTMFVFAVLFSVFFICFVSGRRSGVGAEGDGSVRSRFSHRRRPLVYGPTRYWRRGMELDTSINLNYSPNLCRSLDLMGVQSTFRPDLTQSVGSPQQFKEYQIGAHDLESRILKTSSSTQLV